jgi:ADP-ribosylation factor-like protein 13B
MLMNCGELVGAGQSQNQPVRTCQQVDNRSMFGLANNAYKSVRKKQEKRMTLVLLGIDGAGKTTLLHTIKTASLLAEQGKRRKTRGADTATVVADGGAAEFKPVPTIGFDEQSVRIGGHSCLVYDLGGRKGGRTLWPQYVDEVHGVVFVVDAADAARLDEVREVLHAAVSGPALVGKPVLVIANKQDVAGALSAAELAERLGLAEIKASANQMHACEARNLNDVRIAKAFKWLGGAVAADYKRLVERVDKDLVAKKLREEHERAERKKRIEERKAQRERDAAAAEAAGGGAAPPPPPPLPAQAVEMQPVPPSLVPADSSLNAGQAPSSAPVAPPPLVPADGSFHNGARPGARGSGTVPSTPSAIAVVEKEHDGEGSGARRMAPIAGSPLPPLERPPSVPPPV